MPTVAVPVSDIDNDDISNAGTDTSEQLYGGYLILHPGVSFPFKVQNENPSVGESEREYALGPSLALSAGLIMKLLISDWAFITKETHYLMILTIKRWHYRNNLRKEPNTCSLF